MFPHTVHSVMISYTHIRLRLVMCEVTGRMSVSCPPQLPPTLSSLTVGFYGCSASWLSALWLFWPPHTWMIPVRMSWICHMGNFISARLKDGSPQPRPRLLTKQRIVLEPAYAGVRLNRVSVACVELFYSGELTFYV